jgi:molybdopterin synthase sulfur carrier subunit
VTHHNKEIEITYYAALREESGQSNETLETCAETPRELYEILSDRHELEMPEGSLRVAVNDTFKNWDTPLDDGDEVVFIPPVSGGSKCL